MHMMMCHKCGKLSGLSLLVLGILFLLVDLGVWKFWNIQWWSALIILAGLGHLGHSGCKDCQALMSGKKGK